MTTYIIGRLIQAVFVLFIVTILVFLAIRLLPGDPIMIYMAEQEIDVLTPESRALLLHEFGLDRSLPMQYLDWISGIFRGDFGTSIHYRESVGTLLAERVPVTLHVGIIAYIISSIVGIFFGLVAALRRGGWLDTLVTSVANLGVATPHFWLGILMIYAIGLYLAWLPIQGYTSPFDDFWLSTRQLIMPVICLSVFGIAANARQMRSSMLEVIRQDYVRTAWSKGLSGRVVILKHALKNSIIPVVTLIGFSVGIIFGGNVLVETVFAIPGIGFLITMSVLSNDYIVVQSITLLMSFIILTSNFIVDLSYAWLDPRIRYG